jgi:dipeptide/tripeptide permease
MVAAAMPVFGWLFDRARFDAGFALAALFPLAGFLTWWAINRERAVQRPRGAFTGSP